MKTTWFKISLILTITVFTVVFQAKIVNAAYTHCSSPTATWNTASGIDPVFRCMAVDFNSAPRAYTYLINQPDEGKPRKFYCSTSENDACSSVVGGKENTICNCVRSPDCATLYAADDYSCQTGVVDGVKAGYVCDKPYHCPGRSGETCCRPEKADPACSDVEGYECVDYSKDIDGYICDRDVPCKGLNRYCCKKKADAGCETLYGNKGYRCIDMETFDESKYDCDVEAPCPLSAAAKCCKPKAPVITEEATVVEVDWSPSGCCQQIVPIIDHTKENYGLNHVVQVALNIYKCILCIVGALMVLMTVWGGASMILAAGSKPKIEAGKKMIEAAIIGGIVVVASVLIVNFAVKAFGVNFKNESKLEVDAGL